ncbi:hypothetical protein G6F63_015535 [Rhizopus arrhizus]|nr:hypothetical protein G6F63_015535 [Rhizopus arrhizus]
MDRRGRHSAQREAGRTAGGGQRRKGPAQAAVQGGRQGIRGAAHHLEEPAPGRPQSGRHEAHRTRDGRTKRGQSDLPGRRHAEQPAAGPPGQR